MPNLRFLVAALGLCALTTSAAVAADSHAFVPGFERFFSQDGTDATSGGELLLGELNCTACHKAQGAAAARISAKPAPVLDQVGARANPDYLRKFIAAPHETKPGTTMPSVWAGVAETEKTAQVEALVHFLASTGKTSAERPDGKFVGNGRRLFNEIGCLACHAPQEGNAKLPAAVPLVDLPQKYTISGLSAFLQDPLKVRPGGRMPGIAFGKDEARDLAHYLLREAKPSGFVNSRYSYYEGDWEKLPDFSKLKPREEGQAFAFDLTTARRENSYALVFTGYWNAPKDGNYNFWLTSDDGSKLWIDDELALDNDGIHAPATKTGKVNVLAGMHKVVAAVFNGGGGAELNVEVSGGGLKQQSLAHLLTLEKDGKKPQADDPSAFVFDSAQAEKGRELFATLGCAACHKLTDEATKKPITSPLAKASLTALQPDQGCLAAAAGRGQPQFALSARQRSALGAAVKKLGQADVVARTPQEQIVHTMTAFNCYACHERDKLGLVEDARNELFKSNQKEMGDEGRIPPRLDGVGAKIEPEWMKKIFSEGMKDRHYMFTRMPKFGVGNVGQLAAAFETVDPAVEPVPEIKFSESMREVKADARLMMGDKAFGCIKCHNFNNIPATGIQSLDMATMTKRLKRDWFHRYLLDPQAFRPGTRMPSAWPKGKSQLTNILHGDSAQQLEAMWLYLADGNKAATPEGMERNPIVLFPQGEAIIYRNFIEGAGPRAIGVGYPEFAHLAFDANNLRLAMIWKGSFIDASKHWIGRGPGFQPPLGDHILKFPDAVELAVLPQANTAWPTKSARELGGRFRGYTLTTDGRPTFQYDVAGVTLTDFPNAHRADNRSTLSRTLTFAAGKEVSPVYFRVAQGKEVQADQDGVYTINHDWKVKVTSDSKPVIRTSQGQMELLVPINLTQGQSKLNIEYLW